MYDGAAMQWMWAVALLLIVGGLPLCLIGLPPPSVPVVHKGIEHPFSLFTLLMWFPLAHLHSLCVRPGGSLEQPIQGNETPFVRE